MTSPEPKKRPVPIAPPKESITKWRVLIARFNGAESLDEVIFEDSDGCIHNVTFKMDKRAIVEKN